MEHDQWITQMEVVNHKWHNHSGTVSASSDLNGRKKYSKQHYSDFSKLPLLMLSHNCIFHCRSYGRVLYSMLLHRELCCRYLRAEPGVQSIHLCSPLWYWLGVARVPSAKVSPPACTSADSSANEFSMFLSELLLMLMKGFETPEWDYSSKRCIVFGLLMRM